MREDCLLLPRLLMLHTSVELGKHRIWLGKNNSNVISLDGHSLRMVSQKLFPTTALWFVRIGNSLKTQKYENHLNDILGCLFNQFLHELNDIELFLQHTRLKN